MGGGVMADRDAMSEWAQLYASEGWPVIPLHVPLTAGTKEGPDRATCSCGSSTCTSQGKHPRTDNGLDDASTDADTIAAWWERWPGANIGLRTGVAFDVLDLDGPEAVDLFDYATPDDVPADVLDGPLVITGNGAHYYLQPTGEGNRTNLAAAGSGIDWRGTGGYVVAPPSLHYSGTRYDWASNGRDWTHKLPAVPDWLLHLVRTRRPVDSTVVGRARKRLQLDAPKQLQRVAVTASDATTPYGRAVLESTAGRLAAAVQGSRNATLNTCALVLGHYVAGGEIAERDAIGVLVTGAVSIGLACVEGDRRTEGWATIQSGLTAGMREPKRAPADRVASSTWKGVQP